MHGEGTPGSTQNNLSGRVAVVTGGGRGIGRQICLTFAACGVIPIVVGTDLAVVKHVADEASRLGVKAMAFRADVRSYGESQDVTAAVVAATGRIDILVIVDINTMTYFTLNVRPVCGILGVRGGREYATEEPLSRRVDRA